MIGQVARHIGFCTLGIEIAVHELKARHTAKNATGVLHQFGAGFDALAVEDSADFAAFKFCVGVIGIARAQTQALERPAAEVDVALEIGAELLKADAHDFIIAISMAVPAMAMPAVAMTAVPMTVAAVAMPVPTMAVAAVAMIMFEAGPFDDAVVGLIIAHSDPEGALPQDQAQACIGCPALDIAVGNAAAAVGDFTQFGGFLEIAFGFFFGCFFKQFAAQSARDLETADAHVIGLAP